MSIFRLLSLQFIFLLGALSSAGVAHCDDAVAPWKSDPRNIFRTLQLRERLIHSDFASLLSEDSRYIEDVRAWETLGNSLIHRLAGDDTTAFFGFSPKLEVIKSSEPNAFALKRGHIIVASGLLELIDTSSEYAFIVAHELGHMHLHNDLRRPSLTGRHKPMEDQIRSEIEADRYAITLLLKSGFDPSAPQDLLEKLAALVDKRAIPLGGIYPSLNRRIQALRVDFPPEND